MKHSGKSERDEKGIGTETEAKLDDDVDALFKLPLAEFIGSRNDLAARLKKGGHVDDANVVKALAKPSVTAWAVNQLHWNHREALDQLLATGQRFRQAQISGAAGKIADMRGSLDARRDALSNLSDLATALLRDAGHNPAPDAIHRIITTLEAVSAYAALSGGPTPGRLTHDVDPPGFELLASLIPAASATAGTEHPARSTPSQTLAGAPATPQKAPRASSVQKDHQIEETRRARLAAAKVRLQDAKSALTEARTRAQRLEAAQRKAHAEAKEADAQASQAAKSLREAEERFKKASAAAEDAAQHAERIAAEAGEAAQAVDEAKRTVEKASEELEGL